MARAPQKAIFISYRRADCDAVAGRLKDRFAQALPDWNVFMDVHSIGAGAEFRGVIERALAQASVFIALIGPRWLSDRIREPDDFVRREIAAALAQDMRVIPVLVNDARMPPEGELPAEIQPLVWRNAVELRHGRFDDDFANLATAIAGNIRRPGSKRSVLRVALMGLLGGLAGVAVAMAALMLHYHLTGAAASARIGTTGANLVVPLCALVGAGIMLWRASTRA